VYSESAMSEACVTPFQRSYWVVPGRFLAGFYPGDEEPALAETKLARLLDCGIRTVINLMHADELDHDGNLFNPYAATLQGLGAERGIEVACLRFPIQDMDVPTREMMRRILDAIDASIAGGRPVYVHCWGGVGRTGTVVGCWLVRHGLASGDEAIDRIAELRQGDLARRHRPSPETEAQRALVRSWRRGE
jgi:hypothetical protein